MDKNLIEEFLIKKSIHYKTNISLKQKTWIKRGGVTNFWIEPKKIDHLIQIVNYLNSKNLNFELVGHTSNIYFKNDYNPYIVISTISLKNYTDKDNVIVCDCGVNVKTLSRYAVSKGYIGFEGLIDLPGTVGSAIYNNSSCYECSVSSLMIKIDFLNNKGEIIQLYYDDLKFQNRSSILKREASEYIGGVILKIYLRKNITKEISKVKAKADYNHKHRRKHQHSPSMNLGSVFSKLPFLIGPKLFNGVFGLLARVPGLNELYFQKMKRSVLVYLFGGYKIRRYISKLNINTFVWVDDNADKAFIEYQSFIKRITKTAKFEIEIRSKEKSQ